MFIQTEFTPNPETLKFLPGKTILEKGTLEFKTKQDAVSNELAKSIFELDSVKGIFIGKDFLTITKSKNAEWEEIKPNILSRILDFFASGLQLEAAEEKKVGEEKNYSGKDLEIVNTETQSL